MKELIADSIIMALPHRNWSCELVPYRIKLAPMPDDTLGGNHLFIVVEDKFEFIDQKHSRKVFASQLISRYKGIPAKRWHIVFYVTKVETRHGMSIKVFNFDADNNRQPVIKESPVDYSDSSTMYSRIIF